MKPPEKKRSLRIGIDTRAAQQGSGVRGIGRYIFDLVTGLTRLAPENDYFLFCLEGQAIGERFQELPSCCHPIAVPTVELDHVPKMGMPPRWRNLRDWDRLPPFWEWRCEQNARRNSRTLAAIARRERLDLIHLTNPFDPTYSAYGNYPCPVVKTFYDATPFVLPDLYLKVWQYQIRSLYEKQAQHIMDNVDCLVAISESARADALRFLNVPTEKTRCIYPAVADSFVPANNKEQWQQCQANYQIKSPYFLYCGGGGPNKNRERMTRAFAQFARFRYEQNQETFSLVFAGPDGGDESLLRRIACEEGLSNEHLLFLGFVPDDDLVALFTYTLALLFPSLYEGFGLPPAQALQLGTPVVASDRGALPEVVGDAGFIVDPYDEGSLIGALNAIANDAASGGTLRAVQVSKGKEHVRKFSWERQAHSLLELYNEIIPR